MISAFTLLKMQLVILNFSKKQLELLKNKVDIYSGNDNQTYDFVINGGVGVVSVASHVVGDEISEMISLQR